MTDTLRPATRQSPETSAPPNGWRAFLSVIGPAVVASVAYVDPGNYVTNIQAGARYGYALLWVVLLSNLIAMLFQCWAAELGIVSGRNLAELTRERFPGTPSILMWIGTEIAAMATDLAEFVGGALGVSLLTHCSLMVGMVAMGVGTMALLQLQGRGFRPIERAIGALVAIICVSYALELLIVPVDWPAAIRGSLVPSLPDGAAVSLSIALVGATVMPHAIYLHSALFRDRPAPRSDADRARSVRFSDREVVLALTTVGLVNMAMVVLAAHFHAAHPDIDSIAAAYRMLDPLLGRAAAFIFLLSLLASGLSSSVVGTMAGQVVMQGFVGFRVPVWVRRVLTMLPAFVVIGLGADVTQTLVWSQVVLSFVLPVPMITLLMFSRDPAIMGRFRMSRRLLVLAGCMAAFVLFLNVVLLLQAAGLVPG